MCTDLKYKDLYSFNTWNAIRWFGKHLSLHFMIDIRHIVGLYKMSRPILVFCKSVAKSFWDVLYVLWRCFHTFCHWALAQWALHELKQCAVHYISEIFSFPLCNYYFITNTMDCQNWHTLSECELGNLHRVTSTIVCRCRQCTKMKRSINAP